MLLLISYVWIFFITAHTADIFHLLETSPIVSIYITSSYEGNYRKEGFQPATIKSDINSAGKRPCACVENNLGQRSSNNSCAYAEEISENACPFLSLHRIQVMCGVKAPFASSVAGRSVRNRPHPDANRKCPAGFRKRGKSLTQQEVICFPFSTECPITNVMMLLSAQTVPTDGVWESTGEFTRTSMSFPS